MEENGIINSNYTAAVALNQQIIAAAALAQENLYRMCVLLKQMRDDKLYKELGYQNFEEYCEEEVGLKHSSVYNYISIIEKVKNFQSIGKIGVTKLSLLASLSESQQEEIHQTVDLESVNVKNLTSMSGLERQECDIDVSNWRDKAVP